MKNKQHRCVEKKRLIFFLVEIPNFIAQVQDLKIEQSILLTEELVREHWTTIHAIDAQKVLRSYYKSLTHSSIMRVEQCGDCWLSIN